MLIPYFCRVLLLLSKNFSHCPKKTIIVFFRQAKVVRLGLQNKIENSKLCPIYPIFNSNFWCFLLLIKCYFSFFWILQIPENIFDTIMMSVAHVEANLRACENQKWRKSFFSIGNSFDFLRRKFLLQKSKEFSIEKIVFSKF